MTAFMFHCANDRNHKLLVPSRTPPESANVLCSGGWVYERQIGTDIKSDDVLLVVGDSNVVLDDFAKLGYHEVHVKVTIK
jgi:hypothetical protein